MSYRVMKKCIKKTEFTCLSCKHVQIIREYFTRRGTSLEDCIVKCCADNAVTKEEFSAKQFYCIEYKGFGKLSENEIQKNLDAKREKESAIALREYAKKYICKKDRKGFMEKAKAKRKGNIC